MRWTTQTFGRSVEYSRWPAARGYRVVCAILALAHLLSLGVLTAYADRVDDLIIKRMRQRHITGLSLAIVDEGRIVRAQGYGFTDKRNTSPITPETLFQAGSISKPVTAAAALRLVEQGRLKLDSDVNGQLRTWKVPDSQFTKERKVTVRGILSHSAGLNDPAVSGYIVNSAVPSLVQILDGTSPSNTAAIRVDLAPGTKMRYSSGGYLVVQQLIVDVTRQPFPKFMRDTMLGPLGMNDSTYEQPLPEGLATRAATGYDSKGKAVEGRWHIYPEMAAAGLWTTASDLARFEIAIQQALAGTPSRVISPSMARQMLTEQQKHTGLGVFLQDEGSDLAFIHSGRDEGFDAEIIAYASTGRGVAIMINANDDSGLRNEIVKVIKKQYRW
jgi:CubicO group peptidase (beta-lactamase class C family)